MPPTITVLDDACPWLKESAHDVTSQFGEDGLVAALFARIGVTNRWCFEVGASNGVKYSNIQQWIRQGWHAVLIEANAKLYESLVKLKTGKVHTVHETITPRSLDRILAGVNAPVDMDFGVIDIDKQDFWVWAGLQAYRPRVMLVEVATGPGTCIVPSPLDKAGARQAGADTIRQLGEAKGYRALVRTNCNMLFVRDDIEINGKA